MNPEIENFEALRKIIALKRYEQPPPGYFDRLPGIIITRIERGEGRSTVWERIMGMFVLRPAVACALGMAACGVVALDFVWVKTQPKEAVLPEGYATMQVVRPSLLADDAPVDPSQPYHVAQWLKDTNPAPTAEPPSLFAPSAQPSIPTEYAPGR